MDTPNEKSIAFNSDDLQAKVNNVWLKMENADEKSRLKFALEIIFTEMNLRVKELEHALGNVVIVIERTKNQFKSPLLKELKDKCMKVLNNPS